MRRLVVGISGASGAPYARQLLDFFADHRDEVEPHLVFTRTGRLVWRDEVGTDPAAYGFPIYGPNELTAPPASGSARYDAMVVVPCSAGAAARIAHGVSADLLGRAADVTLKERRPLIVVLRETPLSLVHLRNLVALAEAGATVLPAMPSFYSAPRGVPELLATVTSRVLDHLGIDQDLSRRWTGELQGHARGAPPIDPGEP